MMYMYVERKWMQILKLYSRIQVFCCHYACTEAVEENEKKEELECICSFVLL